jgi:hypothetical protein
MLSCASLEDVAVLVERGGGGPERLVLGLVV